MQDWKSNAQRLATLAALGTTTPEQKEELALITRKQAEICVRLAVARGKVRYDDAEDVVQDATLKALAYLRRWSAGKSSWLTYASRIASTCIADCQRAYQKDARLADVTYEIQTQIYNEYN